MRSLFVKIFLSYWMAQALFFVLAILITMALRPERQFSAWESLQVKILQEAVEAHKEGGAAGVHAYLGHVHDTQHLRAYVFDEHDREISGETPPEWAARVAEDADSSMGWWHRLMMPGRLAPPSLTTSDGHRYTIVSERPPGQRRALFGPHGVPGLGILIGVISSGLVCYLLAWYLTAPVVRLRAATRKLAAGDLTARAGKPWGGARGHDEISELVWDFDTMAERLEKLVNAQSRLLSDISHELRSPLARLNVALALARKRTGPEAESALERIDLEATRLNELIGKLLTIARLEAGDEAMQKAPIDLKELIVEIAKDADFEAQARNARVKVSLESECVVIGNRQLIRSAIENVVRNAIRYTREGTEVSIRLTHAHGKSGAEAAVDIADSGPGVPEESLEKLFRPFYRIDDARGRQTGGVGLGLAIAERAIRLHWGSIRAFNRPQGGLEVEIRLPLASQEIAESIASRPVASAALDR
jgi:two-component system sensor histidine kinase CpxA